jgi:hypothetical protein
MTTKRKTTPRPRKAAVETAPQGGERAPQITIGVPTRGNRDILWLQLESLLRQTGSVVLEVIVYECLAENDSREVIAEYRDKFEAAGHVFRSIESAKQIGLSLKWKAMANAATTPYFIMVGSDDYSPSDMAEKYLATFGDGADWIDSPEGEFFDFGTGAIGAWRKPYPRSGLQCATLTKLLRALPDEDVRKGVDWFILERVKPSNTVEVVFGDGVHTDGYNGITTHRAAMYNTGIFRRPFHEPSKGLSDLVPADVAERMKLMR